MSNKTDLCDFYSYQTNRLDYDIYVLLAIFGILLIVCYKYRMHNRSLFTNKPTKIEADLYTQQIIRNKNVFDTNLYEAKEKMPWIDAITYEDIRKLIRENNFNNKTILSALN